jgi:hypothetical protein
MLFFGIDWGEHHDLCPPRFLFVELHSLAVARGFTTNQAEPGRLSNRIISAGWIC